MISGMPVPRQAPLLKREPLEGPYVLLQFRHPEVAHEARAGQFVMIKAGASAEPPLRRPFSILTVDPREDSFTLFLKQVGPGTRALAALRPGESAACLGPLGHPFSAPPADTEALLVAGGYGIAPFRIFGEELKRDDRRARLFYGGRTTADLQLRDRFGDLDLRSSSRRRTAARASAGASRRLSARTSTRPRDRSRSTPADRTDSCARWPTSRSAAGCRRR